MDEKFALKWNDYQSNWHKSLSQLRNDTEFSDVTLITDDKVKFSAHRVVLSYCSNMFKFILKENDNAKPLLYLGGVRSINLEFILDYIYYGEVSLFQDQLDSFLQCAQKLEIEGLLSQETHHENKIDPKDKILCTTAETKQSLEMENINVEVVTRQYAKPQSTEVDEIDDELLTSEEEIKKFWAEKVKELYKKINGVFTCMVCDYTDRSRNIKRHVEKHIDALSYRCNLCNKEFRTKCAAASHSLRRHQQKSYQSFFVPI